MKNLILVATLCVFACTANIELRAQEACPSCGPNCGAGCNNCLAGNCLNGLCKHDMATKGDVWAQRRAANRPWHGNYYYLPYGQPTALVMPPTAIMHQNYSWGVSQNTMMPTYHQFGPAAVPGSGGGFLATPIWPSHTDQFGLYPVRAPW